MSSFEQYSTHKGQDSLALEFASSAFDAGIQRPINSVGQLANKLTGAELPELKLVEPAKPSSDSQAFAQQAGAAVGMILPFIAARGAVRSTMGGVFTEGRVASMALEGGATGFVFGFGLTPVSDNSSFWSTRLKNGIAEAGTFAALSGTAGALSKSSTFGLTSGDSLARRVLKGASVGAISGLPAGFVNAHTHSILDGNGAASTSQVLHGMRDMAIFGTIFSGAKAGFTRPAELALSSSRTAPVREATKVEGLIKEGQSSKVTEPSRISEQARAAEQGKPPEQGKPTEQSNSVERPTKPAEQAGPEKILKVNRSGRVGEGDEGTVYSNGDGSVTKVYFENSRDMSAVAKMYQRLEGLGLNLPKILEWGRTGDGKPALRMQQVGDGDHLRMQLLTGELTAADRISLNHQYYATADALTRAGIRIDWNLKNMRFESGKLYILDPSFLQETPLAPSIVQMFSGPIGPRIVNR